MTKDQVLMMLARAGRIEKMKIGEMEIDVVEMSFATRNEVAQLKDGAEIMRHAIKKCCLHHGTVNPVFDDELLDVLPCAIADELSRLIQRLSGMDKPKPALEPDPDVETSESEPSEAEKNG